MVFNATFNIISAISWRSVYWKRKPEYREKTTDLSQVTDHDVVHLALIEIQTHNFSGDVQQPYDHGHDAPYISDKKNLPSNSVFSR